MIIIAMGVNHKTLDHIIHIEHYIYIYSMRKCIMTIDNIEWNEYFRFSKIGQVLLRYHFVLSHFFRFSSEENCQKLENNDITLAGLCSV